jgi:competence ComEA-like helix-hairpin-helix protein
MKRRIFLSVIVGLILTAFGGCNRVKYPININTATAAELADLPDIGPKTAALIIAGRPYKTVDDIVKVKGIGEKTLTKIRAKITVGDQPAPAAPAQPNK